MLRGLSSEEATRLVEGLVAPGSWPSLLELSGGGYLVGVALVAS